MHCPCRAQTSQAFVSRVERGEVSPSVDTLSRLLLCLGEDLVLETRRLQGHADHAPEALARARALSMADRLREGDSWAELATSVQKGP